MLTADTVWRVLGGRTMFLFLFFFLHTDQHSGAFNPAPPPPTAAAESQMCRAPAARPGEMTGGKIKAGFHAISEKPKVALAIS